MSSPLSPGTKLSPYEVRSQLGAGGMGEVYRAFDPKINREVAIKILPAAFSADQERLARFEQEAQAAGALNHPNILTLHHIDTHEGSPHRLRIVGGRDSARANGRCSVAATQGY